METKSTVGGGVGGLFAFIVAARDEMEHGFQPSSVCAEHNCGLFFFLASMPSPTPSPCVKCSIRAFNGNGNSESRELYTDCP